AADERLFGGVEEEQARARRLLPQAPEDFRKATREIRIPHIQDDSDSRRRNLREQRLHELQRQIVDAEIAHVFETFVDVALARPRKSRHDDEAFGSREGRLWSGSRRTAVRGLLAPA